MTRGITAVVLIDVPEYGRRGGSVAAAIAGAVGLGLGVVEIDGVRRGRPAAATGSPPIPAARPATRSLEVAGAPGLAAGVALALLAPAAVVHHGATTPAKTTDDASGRAGWRADDSRRTGPRSGWSPAPISAQVQVTGRRGGFASTQSAGSR